MYLTDGTRVALLRVVVWDDDDIYLMQPDDHGSGRTSVHGSGQVRLRQPGHDPPVVLAQTVPPRQVHGYRTYVHQGFNSHGFDDLLSRGTDHPPIERRHGLVIDIRTQPANTRFLMVEVGVRCLPECHPDTVLPFGHRGLVSESETIGDRALVTSAWWRRLVWMEMPPGWPAPVGTPLGVLTDD